MKIACMKCDGVVVTPAMVELVGNHLEVAEVCGGVMRLGLAGELKKGRGSASWEAASKVGKGTQAAAFWRAVRSALREKPRGLA